MKGRNEKPRFVTVLEQSIEMLEELLEWACYVRVDMYNMKLFDKKLRNEVIPNCMEVLVLILAL
jgi:hypothetical protein